MFWVCYMIICRRYCSIGLEHHGVGLFCDRWQKWPQAGSRFFGACMAFIWCDIAQKDLELIGILVSCFASQLSLKCKSVGENI